MASGDSSSMGRQLEERLRHEHPNHRCYPWHWLEVKARDISVIAFNPGLTGGVGGADASALQRALFTVVTHTLFPLIGLFRPEFVMNTPEHSGKLLTEVALGTVAPPHGRIYVSLVKGTPTFPDPSELARDREAQDRLWRESAAMVGTE